MHKNLQMIYITVHTITLEATVTIDSHPTDNVKRSGAMAIYIDEAFHSIVVKQVVGNY